MKTHKQAKYANKTYKDGNIKHFFKIFFITLAVAIGIMGWIDYTSYEVFNPLWMGMIAFCLALLLTFIRWYSRKRNRLDDIAEGDL